MRLHKMPLIVGLLALALAACGSDDDARSTAATTPAPHATVRITVRDYAFDDVPSSIAAGTKISITNSSAIEAHELTAFRLPDGETRPLKELASLPPEELGALLPGAPALALVARPGADGQVVLGDGALHEPGRYLFVCFIPMGAEPDDVLTAMEKAAADPNAGPPRIDGGPPHVASGMIAETTVIP